MSDITVNITSPVIEVELQSGLPGPQGPPGPAGGSAMTYPAGAAVSAQRLVKVVDGEVTHYNPAVDYDIIPAGVAMNGASTGQDVTITGFGPATITGWGLTPGATYWAGANGQVVAIDPENAVSIIVGTAIESDTLLVNIQENTIII